MKQCNPSFDYFMGEVTISYTIEFLCSFIWAIELWKNCVRIMCRLSYIDKLMLYYFGFIVYYDSWIELVIMTMGKGLWIWCWLN